MVKKYFLEGGPCIDGICYGVCLNDKNTLQQACSQMALKSIYGDCQQCKCDCKKECSDIDTSSSECQECLASSLPEPCSELSDFACMYCAKTVWTAVTKCRNNSHVVDFMNFDDLECAKAKLNNSPCQTCICSLICYIWPDSYSCGECAYSFNLGSDLWLNDNFCSNGAIYTWDGLCYKAGQGAFNFSQAADICASWDNGAGNGALAKVDTKARVSFAMQAIGQGLGNGLGMSDCWIGGKIESDENNFHWIEDDSVVEWKNEFAPGFPTAMKPSCVAQSRHGVWKNYDCSEYRNYLCSFPANGF